MAGISASLNTALSAITANSRFFRSTANNVANLETDGFRAEQARFDARAPAGTEFRGLIDDGAVLGASSVDGSEDTGSELTRSNVDVTREITNLVIGSNAYTAAIRVAEAADELLEATIDIKS
jgi:flagellar hook protein FlgE